MISSRTWGPDAGEWGQEVGGGAGLDKSIVLFIIIIIIIIIIININLFLVDIVKKYKYQLSIFVK